MLDWEDTSSILPYSIEMAQMLLVLTFSLFAIANGFNIQPRVVNGDLSNPADYPFYVLLESEEGFGYCGASILSDRYFSV